ncbi:DUF2034 domain-containing protein [Streptomyces sp. DT2A-34]|uniref:restriction endonuclease n=1 Tax=Streptomyces sp. DT2A-34 TaxID=3051182 RepID=UPI00265B8FED|nr:restriction endonuclease [Streptomyces sp. DT2A-34]MDO0917771.1 DUF2034 domain-containing protein [Streptomyces sp. DT2A-34]
MAAKRKGKVARRRRTAWNKAAAGALAALVLLGLLRPTLLLYLGAPLAAAGIGWMVWRLWRTDRLLRSRDTAWRREEEIAAGQRTLAAIDVMSGTEFEEVVAELCRRDGCTQVRRVGGSGDNGADVLGSLPDGRTMVIQCNCAVWRFDVSPAQLGGIWRNIPGSPGLLDRESGRGQQHARKAEAAL